MAPVAAVSHHIGAWRIKRHVSAIVQGSGQVVGAPIAERNHLSPLTRLRSQRSVVECRPCLRVRGEPADMENRQILICSALVLPLLRRDPSVATYCVLHHLKDVCQDHSFYVGRGRSLLHPSP